MIQNVKGHLRSARFVWADKIALLAGLLFLSLFLFLWSLAFFVVGSLGAKHMWGSFGVLGVELNILIVGTFWLVLRAGHFLADCFPIRLFPAGRSKYLRPYRIVSG